ncbi:MAG: VWA domain-containing protein [Vicinamibacterales bacterium]
MDLAAADHGVMGGLAFEAPFWLWLAVAAPVFIWWAARDTLTNFPPRQRRLQVAARVVLVFLVALALARPVWNAESREVSVVYAVDVSNSVSPYEIERAAQWIEDAQASAAPDHSAIVAFAGDVAVLDSPEALRRIAAGVEDAPVVDRASTRLAVALDSARRVFAPGHVRRLVLLGDGYGDNGALPAALTALRADGVLVDTVPLAPRELGDTWVDAVHAPERVTAGEAFPVDIVLASQADRTGTVELRHRGAVLASAPVELTAGQDTVRLEATLDDPGPAILEAVLSADDDPVAANNVSRIGVIAANRPTVLYVEGRAASARYLRNALDNGGLRVATASPGQMASVVPALDSFDAVILSDVEASALEPEVMAALESWVKDAGGGLIMAGGEAVYGDAGYKDSVLERALPVTFDVKEPPDEVAVVLALDRSWSMVGQTIELAKEASKAAVDVLKDEHLIGVITFNHDWQWQVNLQRAENRVAIKDQISRIEPSGHTVIFPALEQAYLALRGVTAKTRHVILLSDGRTYEDAYEGLVTDMARQRITVSTVAVGPDADRDLLGNIATWGHGRSYAFTDAREVPQIFVQETERVVRRSLEEEETRVVVRDPSVIFNGVPMETAPPILGYTRTRARDNAEVLLATASGDPLLARWQYGLGRTALFASDVKDRWSAEWLTWDGYGAFWTRLVRDTMRRTPPDGGLRLTRVATLGGRTKAHAVFEARDPAGRYQTLTNPKIELTYGAGVTPFPLVQTAPGRYEAELPLEAGRDYLAHVVLGNGLPLAAGLPVDALLLDPGADDLRLRPANVETLAEISRQTGGRFSPEPGAVGARDAAPVHAPSALWPWFVALAILLFLGDLLLRRVRIWEEPETA